MNRSVRSCFTIGALLVAAPALAQIPDHTDVVRAAKAAAIAAGVDVDSSECTRFEITKRAAVLLAGEGFGLLAKPSGNNCEGYAVDIVALPAGRIFDIIGAGQDGPNTPHWQELSPVNPDRWRPPVDVVAPPPTPLPSTPIPAPATDLHADLMTLHNDVWGLREDIRQLRDELAALKVAEAEEHRHTRDEIAAFRRAAGAATKKFLEYVPSILSALGLVLKGTP